jgi:ATP-dependent helicase HrpB
VKSDYPVIAVIADIRKALAHQGIALLQAAPGAGKSTVLPLHLLDEPWLSKRKIIMLQPRRIAARAVAQRLAEQLGEEPGATVGYRIRFDTCVSASTRIEVVTEGILARMLQSDPAIEDAGLLVFDEFHERNIHADTALAMAIQVRQLLRPDLRLLVMSATLPAARLLRPLGNPPVIEAPGRSYPVQVVYEPYTNDDPVATRVAAAVLKAFRAHEGDILAFLPGAREINQAKELLDKAGIPAKVCLLYGDLPLPQQREAIAADPQCRRKVVLATNIAETSLTIENVRVVVDCGLARVALFDPRSGLTRLQTQRITRDSAEQRAGRAGRIAPGVCYRLWTAATQHQLQTERKPEIEEADLTAVLLQVLRWGAKHVYELPWITPPPTGAVAQALELLSMLGAVDERGLTSRGKKMAEIPVHPRLAHLLTFDFTSSQQAALAADIAALLDERDILGNHSQADFVLRVEALRKFREGRTTSLQHGRMQRVADLAALWRRWLNVREDNSPVKPREVGYLLLQAYPDRLARQLHPQSARYRLRTGKLGFLDAHDPLVTNKWLVAAHADAGPVEGKIFLAAAVAEEDLADMATPHEVVRWDEQKEMVTALTEHRIGALVLKSEPLTVMPGATRAAVLLNVVREKGLAWLGWAEQHEQWCNRVLSLRQWRPDEPWPDVQPAMLMKELEVWLAPFLEGVSRREELKKLPLTDALNTLLTPEQQRALEKLAPERISVPSGSFVKIFYKSDGQLPHMEIRLQECFGWVHTPTINQGRTPVVMHLLSPGFKPVQVTQDLQSFWQHTYPVIRRELMRKYPKHAWPDDPIRAVAVRGPVRKNKNP